MAETEPLRRSDARANVTRIVETAAVLLAAEPDVSIGEIASRSGVGRSTLYRHFPTREALVAAARRHARDVAELDSGRGLRPPGELANTAATPLSVPEILNKVAPHELGHQIVAEAQRLDGVESAALYLADLAGTVLQRLAGAGGFPVEIAISGTVGTEIPLEAYAGIRAAVARELPGALATPLVLRGRAVGVLVVVGAADDALRDLAREAAVALALADPYTDALRRIRRARPTSAAAEIQQNLLPARIHKLNGATLAGDVLPGYEIGGDWFDVADDAEAVWLGVADIDGSGPRAAGLAAVLLGAFRSARHQDEDPVGCVAQMHEVLTGVGAEGVTASTTIGTWNATTSVFRWVACGTHGPLVCTADGQLEELSPRPAARVGSAALTDALAGLAIESRRLLPGDRLVLLSDGGLESLDADSVAYGRGGLRATLQATRGASAAATVTAIERAICARSPSGLVDDVTLVVLAPHVA